MIDMSASEGRDPYEDYLQINKELETYNLLLDGNAHKLLWLIRWTCLEGS